ncbi:MAG: bifunctional riboflavin kinase/FAD synthetase [Peptococcaceae bacterium]|nr:bifunctional riboflavin kinase/FAD synthetase [Peptococcaceae bacterium]
MQICCNYHGLKSAYPRLMVGLGNFDGVHIGHQALIRKLVDRAHQESATPAIMTFNPHPLAVLRPESAPPLLLSPDAKRTLLAKLGVEVLIQVPFDRTFAALTPEDFIKDVLYRELGVNIVFVGYNYTFGRYGKGTPETLLKYAPYYGYTVEIIPPVKVQNQVVSSTYIRNLLKEGKVKEASTYLGYTPFLEGIVVSGDRRGSTFGFPTANIDPEDGVLIPGNGVYAVKVEINGDLFLGVANIGTRPTFKSADVNKTIEVHVLDFCQDLYGQPVRVLFSRRLRNERKFTSVQDLVRQIEMDIRQVRLEYAQRKISREVISGY